MDILIRQKHAALNKSIAGEINLSSAKFSYDNYSRIKNIDEMLIKRDITVEQKKHILLKELHGQIIKAFSIDKKRFGRGNLDSLKKRLHNLRKIVLKLRSLNYYLETSFIDAPATRKKKKHDNDNSLQLKSHDSFSGSDVELLEHTAYRLIGEAVMLDKKALGEYEFRNEKVLSNEKTGLGNILAILKKESLVLEHLEAKLPPPGDITADLIKEPVFTHWVSRIFALLSFIEFLYGRESIVFGTLKKNVHLRAKIKNKISRLAKEKSRLIQIMHDKRYSMKKFKMDDDFRNELHEFTAIITL